MPTFLNIKIKVEVTSHNFALIPQLPRLQPMDRIVGVDEYFHEWFLIKLVHLTKSLAHQTKEFLVSPEINVSLRSHIIRTGYSPLLGTTVD